jgi:type II secretory pathway component PulM
MQLEIQPGPGGLSVRLQKAPFDTLITWLARLSQQNGIRVDTASMTKSGPLDRRIVRTGASPGEEKLNDSI